MSILETEQQAALKMMQSGDPEGAITLFQKLLAKTPEDPVTLYNTGLCCQLSGRFEAAVGYYQAAIDGHPGFVQAHFRLGKAHQQLKRYDKAISCFEKALGMDPQHGPAAFSLGSLLLNLNRTDEAVHWLQTALPLLDEKAPVYNNLGKTLMLKGDDIQADKYFEKSLECDPEIAEAWFNRAELCAKGGRWDLAVPLYQEALQRNPRMSAAFNNLGHALRKSGRQAEALEAFTKVIELEPDLAEGYYNLGSTCRDMERFEAAVGWLSKAIELNPDYAEAWNNLALTCKNCGDFSRALAYFNRALDINPNLAVAHWNRGFVHLLNGDWRQGWKDFEWRFGIPERRSLYPHNINGPLWDGRPIPGKTLLVHDEQGLGDTFQFLRYLPWVRRRCGRLILETRQELLELLRRRTCIDEIIIRRPDRPPDAPFDHYIPLMSLAGITGTTVDSRTYDGPYVIPPQERTAYWQGRLSSGALNVGLVWAGRPEHANDKNRSCTLDILKPLFDLGQIRYHGLQKGPAGHPSQWADISSNFINLGAELNNFADTAGLLANLDVLITVDTSVAHLAGAMGRPVWLMVPYIPDWRWGLRGTTTPWYPSMTLFRQHRPNDWSSVIEAICRGLVKKTKSE